MEAKSSLLPLSLGLVGVLFNFLLKVKIMFVLIFTGFAHLILCFAMKFKIIFSNWFFLYNSFNFPWILSQNSFLINQFGVSVPKIFSYFNSINGFKKTIWTAIILMWFQIMLMAFSSSRKEWKLRYFIPSLALLKPSLLNLMKKVGELNLMQSFFSHAFSNYCKVLISFLR